jgi:hypothetical protein
MNEPDKSVINKRRGARLVDQMPTVDNSHTGAAEGVHSVRDRVGEPVDFAYIEVGDGDPHSRRRADPEPCARRRCPARAE